MLLLATDTSGKHGSIALARAAGASGKSVEVEVIEVAPLAGGTFSAQLVPQIAALLAKHGMTKNEIDGFVVASGPGSFTGLRVGLAAIKALAEVLNKPIVTVSLLEAIALNSGLEGRVTTLMDAGRGEVYVGEYELAGEAVKVVAERLLTREAVSASVDAVLATTDERLVEEGRAAGLTVLKIDTVDAGTLARLGWRKLRAAETVSPEELEANYIRRSDAEIFSKSSL